LRYQPEPFASSDPAAIMEWAVRELDRVAAALNAKLDAEIEFVHVAPAKPREGMTRGADGTNWDPGSGQGVYTYYNSSWHKLG
jgi:hypothetical protein